MPKERNYHRVSKNGLGDDQRSSLSLAIGNNVPLESLAQFLVNKTTHLIIEFVPKEDSQTKRLLSSREDIFIKYDRENFEQIFGQYFDLLEVDTVHDSQRTLYLMKVKQSLLK